MTRGMPCGMASIRMLARTWFLLSWYETTSCFGSETSTPRWVSWLSTYSTSLEDQCNTSCLRSLSSDPLVFLRTLAVLLKNLESVTAPRAL
uniref:Putative secreted protein n=1 Tax=Ixodes ricinus TaxID=34613 RepID=A0A6B0UAR5_IXORI